MRRICTRHGFAVLFIAATLCALSWTVFAQGTLLKGEELQPEPPRGTNCRVEFDRVGISGPRFGVTWVPGNSEITRRLEEEGMEPIPSQFDWADS